MGLRQIKGLQKDQAEAIVEARESAPFADMVDLARRAGLHRKSLSLLARSGALEQLETNRRQALWTVRGMLDLPLFRGLLATSEPVELQAPGPQEELADDFQSTGFSVHHDPMGMLRPLLEKRGVSTAAQVLQHKNGEMVRAAGIISHRQRPGTASGILFMTLEDETGMLNLVVKPRLFQRQRKLILGRNLLQITARVQREGLSISLLCLSFRPIQDTDQVQPSSRDFR
jgi:error-prone DNA polymerase